MFATFRLTARILSIAVLIPLSGVAGTPMEPMKRTLIVMAHGINPVHGSLFKTDKSQLYTTDKLFVDNYKCNDASGNGHLWKTHGMAQFLEKDVTGTFNHTYAQGFSAANESPTILKDDLANRNWSIDRDCEGQRFEKALDAEGKIVNVVLDVSGTRNMKSFFEQATMRWFEGEILKFRSAAGNPDAQFNQWVADFRAANPNDADGLPSLAETRRDRTALVPGRFIVIVHSMGGLVTREYIHSNYYSGDIDKVVTLDSPMQGSYAVDVNDAIIKAGGIDKYMKFGVQTVGQALQGTLMLAYGDRIIGEDAANFVGALMLWTAGASALAEIGGKVGVAMTLAKGYGFQDGANQYLSPGSDFLLNINSLTRTGSLNHPSPYPFPAFRVFHHEGLISPNDPRQLAANSYIAGFLVPKVYQGAAVGLFESFTTDYISTDVQQQASNIFLSTILGAGPQLNFTQQGTIVVNAKSSRGGDVAMYNQPDTDIRRHLFSIKGSVFDVYPIHEQLANLPLVLIRADLTEKLAFKGLDAAAKWPNMAWVKWLKGPVGSLITSTVTSTLINAGIDQLPNAPGKQTIRDATWSRYLDASVIDVVATSHDYATINSHKVVATEPGGLLRTVPNPAGGAARVLAPTLLEDFLYEAPYASLDFTRTGNEIYPGLLDGANAPLMHFSETKLKPIVYSAIDWKDRMALREETHEQVQSTSSTVRRTTRWLIPNELVITAPIEKFRFRIDDLRPDLMEQFSFTTHYGSFGITWDRIADPAHADHGKYNVWRWTSLGKEFLRTEPSPISDRGEWLFEPKKYLKGNELIEVHVFRDGQNPINLAMTNHAGMTTSQRFHIMFQATEPLITMIWPTPFAVVSIPQPELRVLVNCLSYPGIVINRAESYYKIYPRTEQGDDNGAGVAMQRFDFLESVPENAEDKLLREPLPTGTLSAEGKYWLEINVASANAVVSAGASKRRIPFIYDGSSPTFSFQLPTSAVNPDKQPLNLSYSYADPPLQSLQVMRARIVDADDGTLVYEAPPTASISSGGGSMIWKGLDAQGQVVADGLYSLQLSGKDQSAPDATGLGLQETVLGLASVQPDGAVTPAFITAWNAMTAHPGFRMGSGSASFYLDRGLPGFTVDSFFPTVSEDQVFSLSYRIADGSAALTNQRAKVRWIFEGQDLQSGPDVSTTVEQTPVFTGRTLPDAATLTLSEEQDGLRLRDGRYSFSAKVTDASGNEGTYESSGWRITVDRTAPRVRGFFSDALVYNSAAMPSAPTLYFQVDEDEDALVNRMDPTSLEAGISVAVTPPGGVSRTLTATALGGVKYSATLPADLGTLSGEWVASVQATDSRANQRRATLSFFVNVRPPLITYPSGSAVSGRIGVIGIAPPISPTSAGFSYYELTWRKAGEIPWQTAGIQIPEGRHAQGAPANQSAKAQYETGLLGYWDVAALTAGLYEIRVRVVDQAGNEREHIEDAQVAPFVGNAFTATLSGLPTAPFTPGSRELRIGVGIDPGNPDLGLESELTATQAYTVRITVSDAGGAVLKEATVTPLTTSVFLGTPSVVDQPGIYLWNEGKTWTLKAHQSPGQYKFSVAYSGQGPLVNQCGSPMRCSDIAVTPYDVEMPGTGKYQVNRILEFTLAAGQSAVTTFQLPSTASFLAQKEMANGTENDAFLQAGYFFTGRYKKRPFVGLSPDPALTEQVPLLTLQPIASAYTLVLDGFRPNGSYPQPGTATVRVEVENEKTRQVRSVTGSFAIGQSAIAVTAVADPPVLRLEPGSPFSNIAFKYGLFGGPAFLTAYIRDPLHPATPIVRFFADKQHQDKKDPKAYAVQWKGLNSLNQLVDDIPNLEFVLEARLSQGGPVERSLTVPFAVEMTKWVKAPAGEMQLRVLETDLQDATYVMAKPEFRVAGSVRGKAGVSQPFNYGVEYTGEQNVLAYPSKRYNFFMRRHRDEFYVTVVAKLSTELRGYREIGGVIGNCDDATTGNYHFFRSQSVLVKRGAPLELPLEFGAYGSNSRNYVFRCIASGCATDIRHSLSYFVLPGGVAIPDVYSSKFGPQQYVNLSTQHIFKEENIQLFDNKVIHPGPGFDPTTQKWSATPAGAKTFSSMHFQTNNLPIAGRSLDQARCPAFNLDSPIGDPRDKNSNGIMDAKELCTDNTAFDPNSNLFNTGINFANGKSSWTYAQTGGGLSCTAKGYFNLGLNLKLTVPEEYWDAPFGYNNMANANFRFDPNNQFMAGFFRVDGYDNNGDRISDDGLSVGPAEAAILSPFARQSFRYTPHVEVPNASRYPLDAGGLPVKYTTDHDKGVVSKNNPLVFPMGDNSFVTKERWDFGFNGGTELGGSSMFTATVSTAQCSNTHGVCPETAPRTVLAEFNSVQHRWPPAEAQKIKDFIGAPANYAQMPQTTPKNFRNLFVDIRLKVKPEEMFQSPLIAQTPIAFPAGSDEINAGNTQYGQDAGNPRKIHAGVSGVRFGRLDGFDFVGSVPKHLLAVNHAMGFVDVNGFFVNDLDPEKLPVGARPVKDGKFEFTGTLADDGSGSLAFVDLVHFRKNTLNLLRWPAEQFSTNIKASTVTVSTPTTVTATPVMVGSEHAIRFTGGTLRDWSSIEDGYLIDRDMDGDASQDEDVAGDFADLDGDGAIDEDSPGDVQATLEFPLDAREKEVFLKGDLYVSSAVGGGTPGLSLYNPQGLGWQHNTQISNVSLQGLSVRHLDGSLHADLELDLPNASPPVLDPESFSFRVKKNGNTGRAKEFITLAGLAPGKYSLHFLTPSGGLSPVYPQPLRAPAPGAERVLGYLDISRLQGPTSLLLTREASDGSIRYQKLDIKVGTKVAPGAAHTVSSLYGNSEVFFPDGAVAGETPVTVRVTNAAESGLSPKNNLSAIGPVIEVLPSITFPSGTRPQIKISLTRHEIGSVDPADLRIHKPDGDNLVELDFHVYNFFQGETPVCGTDNPTGICNEAWDKLVLAATTSSFSHFVVLDRTNREVRTFEVAIEPAKSMLRQRELAVTGLPRGAFFLSTDDDPVFNETGDPTPAIQADFSSILDEGSDYVRGLINLTDARITYIFVSPNAANGKVKSVEAELIPSVSFRYSGASLLRIGGGNSTAEIAYSSNQDGVLVLELESADRRIVSTPIPVANTWGMDFIVSWEAIHGGSPVPDGRYKTHLTLEAGNGQPVRIQGPDIVVDYQAPLATLRGAVIKEAGSTLVRLSGRITDADGFTDSDISLHFGPEPLRLGLPVVMNGDLFEMEILLDDAALANCNGCRLSAELFSYDKAFNTARAVWSSDPVMVLSRRTFRIQGGIVPGKIVDFMVPVSVDGGTDWFDFESTQPDGSDVYFQDDLGSRMLHETEFFDKAGKKGLFWVTVPFIKASKPTAFFMNWSLPGSGGDPVPRPQYTPFASIWRFTGGNPGADYSGNAVDAIISGSGYDAGLQGNGLALSGPVAAAEAGHGPVLACSSQVSASMWVKFGTAADLPAVLAPIFRKGTGTGEDWSLRLSRDKLAVAVENHLLEVPFNGIATGSWTHIAFSFTSSNGGRTRIYVNGREIASGTLNGGNNIVSGATGLVLGGGAFHGIVDEVHLSRETLSPDWFLLEYEAHKPFNRVVHPDQERLNTPLFVRSVGINTSASGLNLAQDLVDFPVKVELKQSLIPDFPHMQPDNIAFADEFGALLPFDVETWQPDQDRAVVWVRLPKLPAGRTDFKFFLVHDQRFRLVLNHAPATWSPSFQGVWHMSSANQGMDAAAGQGGTVTAGKAQPGISGHSLSLTGPGQRMEAPSFPNGLNLRPGFTLEGWYSIESASLISGNQGRILSKASAVGGEQFGLGILPTGNTLSLKVQGSTLDAPANTLAYGGWHQVLATVSATGESKLFHDGQQVAVGNFGLGGNLTWNGNPLLVGRTQDPASSQGFMGLLDEVRVQSSLRDPSWVAANYLNQSLGNASLQFGDEEIFTESIFRIPPAPSVEVRMKEAAVVGVKASRPSLQIVNDSENHLSGLTMRLWLSREENPGVELALDPYVSQPCGIRYSVRQHPENGNLLMVDLVFPEDFILPPGESTPIDGIQLGLHFRNPHSQTWNRDNDPSWAGNASSYVTTDKVTLYNRLGELIYGQEPDPASIPAPLNPAPVAGTRVDRAVQALYFHHEGSGNRASDRSSAGIPLDLLISGTGTAWIPTGGLEFTAANHGSILQNRTPNTKLFSSSTVSGEVTLEAWISTSNFTHDFARILAYTPGDGQLSRNWDLVQTGRNIEFRLRTSSSESVSLATTGNPLAQAGTRYQITATYKPYTTSTGQGGMRIYVNGVQVAANTQAGVIQASGTNAWNSGYVFAAGNKPGPADKGWQGVLHLTAIYSAALTAAEVQQNHSVGVVEPALPPMALVGVQCGDRLLPVLAGDGISPWNEDKNPLGASLQMNGVTYPKGIGARTAAGGKTSFLVYPIEDERLRLGLSGKAVRLTGFTGLQQGASVGGTQFKISRSDRMPSDQEWISNSGSVEALMTSNNGANVPVDLDVSGAKWLFLGMSSTAAQPDVSGVFGELQVRFGGDAPAIDPPAFLPGLAYRYHEGTWDHLPDFSAMIPLQEGITTGFSLAPRLRDENFAFEFSGHLRITAVGTYTFFTSSDDGSRLFIDGQQVVDNDGLHGDQEASGSLQLSPGMHAIKVTYFERSGSEVLAVRYQGPGISKILIPTSELFRPGPGMFSGAERSEAGLKALYLFRREAGETVYDLAPSGLPQDLELSGDGTDWLQGGGVGFNPGDHNSLLMNVAPNAKIAQAAIQTGMLSVETWIEASDVNLNEFRRIMELASRIGNGDRNFAVSQKGKNLEFALRTSGGANVSLLTSGNPLQFQSGRYHVVMTYRRSGLGPDAGMRIYVNGILAAQNTEAGVLSATGSNPWNNDYVLSVGNRPGTLDRDWGGGIFLAAIYDHALTPDQIRTLYQAGIPSRTSTEVIPVGVTRWERLLPLDAVDGMSLWQEDRSASGNPISMGGIGFRTGISGQPQANGAAVWMLYDLEKERQELGLSGIPLRLTGYAGRQDGSGSVNIKIKTSKSVSEPPAADWLSGSAGTQERFSASDATNVALDVDLYGAKWLWLEQSAQGQANPGQGVFGQIKAHFGRDPALSFVPKVEYRYFEIPASALPDFDALIPVSTGFIGQFDLSPRLRNDNFAFEFRGLIQIHASGTYTFYTSSDDGSRLFIDGKLIVDNDGMHGMQERSGTVALDPGHHTIKVQYFDCTGSEALTVDIQGPGLAKQAVPAGMLFHSEGFRSGIKAKEFLGQWSALPDFASLTPAGESLRNRFQINPRTRGDDFGFDFQGHFYAPSQGSYTFYISSDDGSRLYIDGNLLVDNDGLHGMQERSGSAVLEKGFHPIRVAYFERSGSEGLEVRFQGPNLPKALIPSEMLFVRTYPTPCIGTQCGTGSAILMGGENLDRNYALNGSQWFRIPLAQYANQSAHTVMVALDDMDGRPMEGTFRFEGRADQNLNAYFQSFPTAYTGQAELFFTIEAPVSRSYKVRWWFQ